MRGFSDNTMTFMFDLHVKFGYSIHMSKQIIANFGRKPPTHNLIVSRIVSSMKHRDGHVVTPYSPFILYAR
jgi:hypothetical protein